MKCVVILSIAGNIITATLMVFVSKSMGHAMLGAPNCPIQYVCFQDDQGSWRFNSTIPGHQ